ncbi:MAG: SLC13 family permease [Candidatus Thorarchaeota archaeon]|jgi:Na+/H+ antiporter NhaD/arsenite permease-like protein
MDVAGGVILLILIGTLVVILSERIDETATALFGMSLAGAVLYLAYGVKFREFVITVLFVTAMLIVVAIAASSGMFQYIALILIHRTGGKPRSIFITFMGFVFVISMFLDPLPTMLVMGAFTVEVCKTLDIDFRPLLISEVIVANFASIPSLVGSVPNLVIVVWAEIEVGMMFLVLLPLSLILFAITIPLLLRYYGPQLKSEDTADWNVLYLIKPSVMIKSRHDFYLSIIAMSILVLGFTIGALRVEASLIAMMVASGMLVFSHERAKDLIRHLSWDTIFFLVGLFGIVAALQQANVITEFVNGVTSLIGNNAFLGISFLLWVPGLVLSIIDNIPIAALLAPLGQSLGAINPVVPLALIVGINVGGYMIPFGDAPNMIAIGLASDEGKPIHFREFTKVAFPLGLLHLVVSTIYSFLAAIIFTLL